MVVRTPPGPLSVGLYCFLCILTVAVSVLFASREWRTFQIWRAVSPLELYVKPVSCEPDPANTGEIIHIDCPLRRLERFYPPAEFSSNVLPFDGIFIEMKVEMYQWVLQPQFLGVKVNGVWSQDVLSRRSAFGLYDARINPDYMPRVTGAGRRFAKNVYGGGFLLPRQHLTQFRAAKQLPLVDDTYYTPSPERPPTTLTSLNTQVWNDALYSGDPQHPQIGDIRLTFWGSASTHVSAIGEQTLGKWGSVELGSVGMEDSDGVSRLDLVAEGDWRPGDLIREYKRRKGGSWETQAVLRTVEWLLLAATIGYSYRLIDRFGHTRLGPLVLGSTLLSGGALCLAVSALWFFVHAGWATALILLGSGLVAGGVFAWRAGKSLLAPWELKKPASNGTPPAEVELLLPSPKSNNSNHFNNARPQHFYQAI